MTQLGGLADGVCAALLHSLWLHRAGIEASARAHGVDPDLVAIMVLVESVVIRRRPAPAALEG